MNRRPERRDVTYPLDVAREAALVGGVAAIPGTITGAFFGTIRTQTPILFSLVSGAQWFALGSTFYAIRTSILNRDGLINSWYLTRGVPLIPCHDDNRSPKEHVYASTISGALTGFSLGLLFRGPRNAIPGTIMFGLFGFSGQHAYNWSDRKNSEAVVEMARPKSEEEMRRQRETFWQRVAKSKYSPISVMSDDDYLARLNEKLLQIEAEIALVDDKINEIKAAPTPGKLKGPLDKDEQKK